MNPTQEEGVAPRRALIVDDDPLARELVAMSFTEMGFSVASAAEGLEALALAANERFACVVLDVQMPGPSGFEVCRELRRMPAYRSVPILIQTGLDDHDSVEEAFRAGASDYLTKPINDSLLRHRVRFVMKAAEVVDELQDKRAKLDEALALARMSHFEYSFAARRMTDQDFPQRVLGLDEAITVEDYLSGVHPDDRETLHAEIHKLMKSGERCESTHRWLAPDGRRLVIRLNAILRRDENGTPVAVVGSAQDVTERESILETMRLWSKVIESSAEGMLLADAELQPLQVNAAFTRITGLSLERLGQQGWDFLDEGFRRQIVPALRSAGSWQGERSGLAADGSAQHLWINVGMLPGQAGRPGHYVVMVTDVSALRRYQSRLDYLSRHDPLTGLPNRAAMMARLHEQIVSQERSDSRLLGLLYLDLDRYKNINDALGQQWGDRVLLAVVDRLRSVLPPAAVLGRPESDEFLVMMPGLSSPADAVALAESLLAAMRPPLRVEQYELVIGASIGLAFHPLHASGVDDLIRHATIAMHRAKARGRNRYQLFNEQMADEISKRLSLEVRIRSALSRGEFCLHYQPKVDLRAGRVIGAEALIRWQDPNEGFIPPDTFVPVAEASGLIADLGRWVFQEAAAQMMRWEAQGVQVGHVAVNVSGPQVWRADFLSHIQETLHVSGLSPQRLQIEITETLIMRDSTRDETVRRLAALRDLGLVIAIDDFGTGYSSLSRLKRLPIATLKIDKSFVGDVTQDGSDSAIVRAIIAMARTMGMDTVAEGIETPEQLARLRAEGCDIGQGFLFGKALPAPEFAALVRNPPVWLTAPA